MSKSAKRSGGQVLALFGFVPHNIGFDTYKIGFDLGLFGFVFALSEVP